MASKAKKRGKVTDESVTEKENVPSRRTGRTKKEVNYNEESPYPANNKKKKGEKNTSTANNLEKVAIQNAKEKASNKRTTKEQTDHSSAVSETNVKSNGSKSKTLAQSNSKKKDTKTVQEDVIEESVQHSAKSNSGKAVQVPSESDVLMKAAPKSGTKRDRKGKIVSKDVENEEKVQSNKDADDLNELELITDTSNDSRKGQTKANRKQTKDNARKTHNKQTENQINEKSEKESNSGIKENPETIPEMNKHENTHDKGSFKNENVDVMEQESCHHDNKTTDAKQESCLNTENKKTANNTFTVDDVPETPVISGTRRTPGRNIQPKTPSSESRVHQVKENLRNSLCTPTNTAHADCSDKMSQIYEILELVTEQLTDLKSEMEIIKSTNESMKTELESTQNESRRLREEMDNLKNTTVSQKSLANPDEVDILLKQCDSQKKTIRSLHEEVDSVRHEFNQKFDKYKKAMVFILCKTRPDTKHSDVSKLRNMLNKTEQYLDLTLDDICSSMETVIDEIPIGNRHVAPSNCTIISESDTTRERQIDQAQARNKNERNENMCVVPSETPQRQLNTSNPFQTSHRIKRTPVGNPPK